MRAHEATSRHRQLRGQLRSAPRGVPRPPAALRLRWGTEHRAELSAALPHPSTPWGPPHHRSAPRRAGQLRSEHRAPLTTLLPRPSAYRAEAARCHGRAPPALPRCRAQVRERAPGSAERRGSSEGQQDGRARRRGRRGAGGAPRRSPGGGAAGRAGTRRANGALRPQRRASLRETDASLRATAWPAWARRGRAGGGARP